MLVPNGMDGELHRWVDPKDPSYLRVDVGHDEPNLFIDVTLRGRPHARFQLQRVEGAELAELPS